MTATTETKNWAIRPRDGVEIYLNAEGSIVLRAQDLLGDDAILIVEPADVPALIKALRKQMHFAKKASR